MISFLLFLPHKEHGRDTLYSHWQVCLEQLSIRIQNLLFINDEDVQLKSREEFLAHVDQGMGASYVVKRISACSNGCKSEGVDE